MPDGKPMANTWQGAFPNENLLTDGYARTSPVREFPANGYGLFDMIGNVWEWTSDYFADGHEAATNRTCCAPRHPRGAGRERRYDPAKPAIRIPRKVLRGGDRKRGVSVKSRSARFNSGSRGIITNKKYN